MRRVLATSLFALVAAATAVAAQDTTIKSETKIKADDAKVMTITGCVSGGPTDFVLTNVTASQIPAKGDNDKDKKAVATSGVVESYALVPREGVALAPHVGHRVELVGVVVDAKSKGDDDAKIQIRERSKVERENAPDSKAETTTKAKIARTDSPQFAITSLKMVSPICLQ
jgi:hypothetical protein